MVDGRAVEDLDRQLDVPGVEEPEVARLVAELDGGGRVDRVASSRIGPRGGHREAAAQEIEMGARRCHLKDARGEESAGEIPLLERIAPLRQGTQGKEPGDGAGKEG